MAALIWRKSSFSYANGQCVEIACLAAVWQAATASGHEACVEVTPRNGVAVRDSKNPQGRHLHFGPRGWNSFVTWIKDAA